MNQSKDKKGEKQETPIFACYKCGHLVYISEPVFKKLAKLDCPNCGEEAYQNWIFYGVGDFKKWKEQL